MIAALVLALLSLTSVAKSSESEDKRHRAECLMWSKLENQTLPLQDQGHANCSTNNECTGFNCVGLYQVGIECRSKQASKPLKFG